MPALALLLIFGGVASYAQPAPQTARDLELNEQIRGLSAVRAMLSESERPIRVLAQFSRATAEIGGSPSMILPMSGISQAMLTAATMKATSSLEAQGITGVEALAGLPLVTFELKRSQLSAMAESGQFASVVEDRLSKHYLGSSGGVIDVPELHSLGVTGVGQTVAILDTGVDIDHPFLNGRVVEGACFSSNFAAHGATSLCPGGVGSATTVASGNHCTGIRGCDHGTHVAGIAAGRPTGAISITGVAPDANIMAVKVFSRFDDVPGGPNSCFLSQTTSPCILSYDSDQIRGLQRVVDRAIALNIVAANMSLGGGSFSGACDTAGAALKTIIDQLLVRGAVTVIAAGNDGSTNSIGSPGCISTAVTVGSTTDADNISGFSNLSNTVDLLAPGSNIQSSVPGTGLRVMNGTSMAAPQVAGAFAALASCPGNPSVTDIQMALKNSGVSVTDSRLGGTVSKIRIDLDAAAGALCPINNCIDHNLGNLRLRSRGWWFWRTWTIVDGSHQLFYFGRNRSEGQQALNIIRQFAFTSTCYIGRPDASMQYLRAGNTVPGGSHGSIDCLPFNRANIRIEAAGGGQWRLTDGVSSIRMFPNQGEVQQAVDAINTYHLNRQCFVGRPDPSFTFWLSG